MSSNVVQFTPPDWYVATDADIADGAKVGELNSRQTLGLFGNGCNQVLNVDMPLLEGTIDMRNPVEPLVAGKPNRLKPLGINDANGVPAASSRWPSYLTTVAQRSGMDLSKLRARFVGVNATDIAGLTIIWNFLVFQPGAQISRMFAVDLKLGYPTVSIVQDPTAPGSGGDPVTDFCAPLWSEYKLFDTVGGTTYRRNPGDGFYNFTTFSIPAPDADNDGIENAMDPCPYSPNLSGWDPRSVLFQGQPGDPEPDGLPDDCDPDPDRRRACDATGMSPHDEECDGWKNRIDNCPLVHNGYEQREILGVGNQADTDGDGIGDACDQDLGGEDTVDGQNLPLCNVSTVIIGSGGPPAVDPKLLVPCGFGNLLPSTGDPPGATATPAAVPRTGGPPEGGDGMGRRPLLIAGLLLAGLGLSGVALKRLYSGL